MAETTFRHDLTQRDDAAYWAAALVYAIKAADQPRTETARQNLRRLGYDLQQFPKRERRKAVVNATQ